MVKDKIARIVTATAFDDKEVNIGNQDFLTINRRRWKVEKI